MLRQAFVQAPGHCTFTAAETVAGIETLDRRIATGRWDEAAVSAAGLDHTASAIGPARFIGYRPATFLRPCGARPGSCLGELKAGVTAAPLPEVTRLRTRAGRASAPPTR